MHGGKKMREELSLISKTSTIIGLNDKPILRNLLITQCYCDLSTGLATALGSENANWCTFATWASKTAGRFIRNEEVPALLRKQLAESTAFQQSSARLVGSVKDVHDQTKLDSFSILDLAEGVMKDVSGQIRDGNLKVFSELGPLFARFLACFEGNEIDLNAAEKLRASLRVGPSAEDGQSLFNEALGYYIEAAKSSSPVEKAQNMLVANALTGLHEQIRLQSYIAGSLNAPVADVLGRLWGKHVTPDAHPSLLGRIAAAWDRFGNLVVDEAEKVWDDAATKELMTLAVPGQTLHLGSRLPPARPGQPLYSQALLRITTEEGLKLGETYDVLDPKAEGLVGASDWTRLSQRMKYIIALFRSRQQVSELLGQPFTDVQRRSLMEYQMPQGALS
jgi:hypothetical protein